MPHAAVSPACGCCQPLLPDTQGPQCWLQACRLAVLQGAPCVCWTPRALEARLM